LGVELTSGIDVYVDDEAIELELDELIVEPLLFLSIGQFWLVAVVLIQMMEQYLMLVCSRQGATGTAAWK
uniref:Rad21_Rec8 domain-containing protein n=1 Tax=Haemonchus placei TaxID=6290 RepID=A0A0N4WX88_HAEPC